MRFSTPTSRRNVTLYASAENVVARTLIPAMPGTITSRFFWSDAKTAPNRARNSRGSMKLKNAAVGLRQNMRRSSRYWRQTSPRSLTGRQLQVHVLERRARHRQRLQSLAPRQRVARELVQEARRVIGLVHHGL